MHVDDLANALLFIMENYSDMPHLNVGVGTDLEIRELAEQIGEVVGFKGGLAYDTSKPDGTPRKLMDSTRLFSLGWRPKVDLPTGLARTYDWFLSNQATLRA
jgi:GDP-L-fucose synthase